jgi:uncharacterized protein
LPLSGLLAWSEVNHHPAGPVANSTIYALSVIPLSLAYVSAVCIWYAKHKDLRFFRVMAAPGRMALTNYIGPSATGMILFYGIGFGLALTGLIYVELIAAGVFAFQILFSGIWLRYFRFGPLEWIWRMLTYGKYLSPRPPHKGGNPCAGHSPGEKHAPSLLRREGRGERSYKANQINIT